MCFVSRSCSAPRGAGSIFFSSCQPKRPVLPIFFIEGAQFALACVQLHGCPRLGAKEWLGHATSYHLVPLVPGTSRHVEAFTKKDFWVTLYKPTEMFAKDLLSYVSGESVSNADVVV